MRSTAKSLVLDLLGAAPTGELTVRALLRSAALFDIAENSVRVALARLRQDGLVVSTERGVYALGDSAAGLHRHVTSWRDAEKQVRKWDGSWVAVHTAGLGRSDRGALRRRDRALELLGLRELDRGLLVRPANLKGGVESVRERLSALGLDEDALVFRVTELASRDEERALHLWDVEALESRYADLRVRLEESLAVLREIELDDAARDTFLLGGEAIRQIVFDPLLPDPIVNVAERKAFVDAMRRYDRTARAIWRQFLEVSGGSLRSAADLSGVDREDAGSAIVSEWTGR